MNGTRSICGSLGAFSRVTPLPFFRIGRRFNNTCNSNELEGLVKGIREGHTRCISRAITLGESSLHSDRNKAAKLMSLLLKQKRSAHVHTSTLRLGISGPPGVGKSTLIEQLGLRFIEDGHKVGVLAIDPSSNRSGGSILGDKTRMPKLSVAEKAYIRPSPSRGYLGGVARGTHGSVHILEAAGYDRIVVETVGVGQSEVHVDSMVDLFLLLLPPAGGDELQGIKKGVVELADIIAITKADGQLLNAANHARNEYSNALTLLRPKSDFWKPKTITCSTLSPGGLDNLIAAINEFEKRALQSRGIQSKREAQAVDWMWKLIEEDLVVRVQNNPQVKEKLPYIVEALKAGDMLAEDATDQILQTFLGEK